MMGMISRRIAMLFFIVTINLFCSTLSGSSMRFDSISRLGGYTCDDEDVVFVHYNASTIECSFLCSMNSTCVGVFTSQSTLSCIGCGRHYTTEEIGIGEHDTTFFYNSQEVKDWQIFGDSYYKLYQPNNWNFTNGKDFCQSQSSTLVHFDTKEENTFVEGIVRDNDVSGIYIGLVYDSQDWKWIDDDSVIMGDNWHSSEPSQLSLENCASLDKTINYQWADSVCDVRQYALLCEKKLLN